MNEEFKKLSQGDVTRYVLENATGMGASSIASMPMPMGGMQRRKGNNLIAQEADKKTVPASTPRNFVAKNAKTAGAGAHKDKSKTIPRKEKHKKPYMEALQARLDQLKSNVAEGKEDKIKQLRQDYADKLRWSKEAHDPAQQRQHRMGAGTIANHLKKQYGVDVTQGVAEGFNGEYDDEAGMAQSNLLTTARAVMGLLKTIKDRDNLPEWGQEKIAKAEMMLVSVWDYLQSQKAMGNDPQQGVAEGAPELLKQEMPLVRHIEQELAQHGYEKGTPEYDQMFKHTMSMYRKFGNVDAIKRGVAEGSSYNIDQDDHDEFTPDEIVRIKNSHFPDTLRDNLRAEKKEAGRAKHFSSSSDGGDSKLGSPVGSASDNTYEGVAEGSGEAEAYKAHLIKTMPQMMNFLSKKVKGWTPGKEEMLGAIDTAYMVMKHTGDVKQAGKAMMDELNTLHRMSQGQQGVAEGDAGLSKDAETNFHAKLDQLVHATFGKRKSEQDTDEDMSRRGFLKGAGAMAAGISAAGGAHANEKSDPNKLIAIVNIDGESKEFNLTGKFKGDVKSQLHQAEDFITEFLEKRDINFSNLELRYQGAVLKTQNTGSVREEQGVAEGAKVDRQAKHITASMMKKGKSKKDAEGIAWAHIKHPKNESADSYFESLQQMVERQLEPTMDLDAWNNNFQNADPNKYHQFKNKTPEKKK